jgi:hypothetical protein
MASTLVVFYIAYRLFGVYVAWSAFLLSLFSTPLFLNAMNGMETALFTFLGLAAVALYIDTYQLPENRRNSRLLAVGVLLGLANLTRGDGIFLSLAFVLLESVSFLKKVAYENPLVPKLEFGNERVLIEPKNIALANLAALLAGIFIFTLPAVVWSLVTSGSPFPANQVGRRFIAWQGATSVDGAIIWPAYFKQSLYNVGELSQLVAITVGSVFIGILALVTGLWDKRSAFFVHLTALYIVLYFIALIAYQGYFPNVHGLRYLNLVGHLLTISIAAFYPHSTSIGS